jgi:hypothetical protein
MYNSKNPFTWDEILPYVQHIYNQALNGRPLLPKNGGLVQVDIGGHPHSPYGSKQLFSNFDNLLFLAVFRVLNFRSHFEALNDVFLGYVAVAKFCATVVFLR